MARKIKSMDEIPVDPVAAVKRSFLQRGFIFRKKRSDSQLENEAPTAKKTESESQQSNQTKQSRTKATTDSDILKKREQNQGANDQQEEQEPGEVHEKLIDLTEKAHDVLFEADTVFPFTPFPSTITLDREKLSVANRTFFRVAKIITVPVTSLISAEADVGPFFGSVKMTSKYFINTEHSVHFLWRNDASEIHRLLQGFIIAQEKGLDVTDIEVHDLKVLLHDLGQGVSD